MEEVKYRVYFIRKGEEKPFQSCIVWSKFGPEGAISYAKDSFKLKETTIVKAKEIRGA